MWNSSKNWLINLLGGYTSTELREYQSLSERKGYDRGYADGGVEVTRLKMEVSRQTQRFNALEDMVFKSAYGAQHYIAKKSQEIEAFAPSYDVNVHSVNDVIHDIHFKPQSLKVMKDEEYPEFFVDECLRHFYEKIVPEMEDDIRLKLREHNEK